MLALRHGFAFPGARPQRCIVAPGLPPFSACRVRTAATGGAVSADTASTAFWDYNLLFASQRAEAPEAVPLRVVDGSLPSDFPLGTYYLTGPGILSDGHGSVVNPLDGHGYLRSFHFDGHQVMYAARYVETEAKLEEAAAGSSRWRFTRRGPFSLLRGGKRVGSVTVMKNVANTAVVQWAGRLLCLWEGGQPYEVDPLTLKTVGRLDIADGRVMEKGNEKMKPWGLSIDFKMVGLDAAALLLKPVLAGVFSMPSKRLLAHCKIDPARNRLLMLACNAEDMLLPISKFTFYEFDGSFDLVQTRVFTIPEHLIIHDWAFTDNHYVVVGNRIKIDLQGSLLALSGHRPMISALAADCGKRSTPVYLLPRFNDSSHCQWRTPIEAPPQLWVMHVANAYEERDVDDGDLQVQLQMSACSYHWFSFHKMFGYDWRHPKLDPSYMNSDDRDTVSLPHLVRVSITIGRSGPRCSVERLPSWWRRSSDLPTINPGFAGRHNDFIYAAFASGTRKLLPNFPFDSVAKINVADGAVRAWSAGYRRFVGEPVFVPAGDGEEDDGYVLVVEYAASRRMCFLVVLDARKLGGGGDGALVARLEVPSHLSFPLGFHGFWAGQ